ncbi:MAG: hypothetical protein AAF383_03260 [Cyanobacteria bacterium P01_A01_bin.83]
MFDLIIELNPNETEEEIDVYSLGNITINGKYGSLTSKRDKPPFQDTMIFIDIPGLLDSAVDLVTKGQRMYEYIASDSSFVFWITNRKNRDIFIITDFQDRIVSKSTATELVQSIWQGVDSFISLYRPFLKDNSIAMDLDDSINKFRIEFSQILNLSAK